MLDEFRSTSITWDKATRRIYSPITANASDSNGRKLNIQVVNSGQVENLTGATLHLYWETKDKLYDGLDAFDASDISKGEFEIFYTTGMLSNVGELNATLVLVDSTGKVVSDWFKITVTRGINEGAIESENSFSSLTQALIDISNLEQNYAPRLNDLTAQLQQIAIHVKDFGAKGDGTTDDRKAIQDAIDMAATVSGKVIFDDNKTYAINSEVGLYMRDNIVVDMGHATLKSLPNNAHHYAMYRIYKNKNVKIITPTLIGDRNEHITTPSTAPNNIDGFYGEWGFGFDIRHSQNITIVSPTIKDMWGDGIYFGNGNPAFDTHDFVFNSYDPINSNINILGVTKIANCRRQGISVICLKDSLIEEVYIKDIQGTMPSAGIDFEPNQPHEIIDNITINTVNTENCETPVMFCTREGRQNIKIGKINVGHNRKPWLRFYAFGHSSNHGSIEIGEVNYEQLINSEPLYFEQWVDGYTPKVIVDKLTVKKWENNIKGQFHTSSVFNMRNLDKPIPSKNFGGIYVNNVFVVGSSFVETFKPFYVNTDNTILNAIYKNIRINFSEISNVNNKNTPLINNGSVGTGVVLTDGKTRAVRAESGTNANTIGENDDKINAMQFFHYDGGRPGTSNYPSGRGFIIEMNDNAYGKMQLAFDLSGKQIKVRQLDVSGVVSMDWTNMQFEV